MSTPPHSLRSQRWRRNPLLAIAALVALSVTVAPAQSADPPAAFVKLVTETDPSARRVLVEAVLRETGNDTDKTRKLIAADTEYPKLEAGWHVRKFPLADGPKRYTMTCHIRIPTGYTPSKPWPVLVAAHGQFGTGPRIAKSVLALLGDDAERYVLIAPTLPGPRGHSGKPYQEKMFQDPLDWVRRNVNVDDDRIYMTGYSMGGHGTWRQSVFWPHMWAATVPCAGCPVFEFGVMSRGYYMENLAATAVWGIWGEKDTSDKPGTHGIVDFCRPARDRLKELGYDHVTMTELPGVGHGGCWPQPKAFQAYLRKHTRTAPPAKVHHTFHQARHGRGWWLEAVAYPGKLLDFSQPIRIELAPGEKLTDARIAQIHRKHYRKHLVELIGLVDRKTNTITVQTVNVLTVRLRFPEGLIDLGRPVTVRYAGRTWRGRVPVSARCMLSHYAEHRDAGRLIVNEMILDARKPARLRYPARRSSR